MAPNPIALIAHDLKNALGALEGELAGLVSNPTPSGAQGAFQRCLDLRRHFVQFLTVYGTDGTLRAHCEDESPAELLESVQRIGSARYLHQAHSPRVCLQVDDPVPPYWYFDRRLAQLALDAALHNASRFAREQITLSARQDQGYLVFAIDDDGPGLGTADTSSYVTGLGSTLCQAVAQAHQCGDRQGRMVLRNRPTGGTRFELWLP